MRASLSVFPPGNPPAAQVLPVGAAWLSDPRTLIPSVITPDIGGLESNQARQIVGKFIESLQQSNFPVPPANIEEWVTLRGSTLEGARDERQCCGRSKRVVLAPVVGVKSRGGGKRNSSPGSAP